MLVLNKNNIIDKMLNEITEIKNDYLEEMELWDDDPGLHNIFGDVFNPFLDKTLKSNSDILLINRIFNFLEEMATSTDEYVQEVLAVTILERLGDDPIILKRSREYMGSNTLKVSKIIEKDLGRE